MNLFLPVMIKGSMKVSRVVPLVFSNLLRNFKPACPLHFPHQVKVRCMKAGIRYILLADDDPDDQDAFSEAFIRHNPNAFVKTVNDGKELLEWLDGCPADGLPTLIMLDYKMPVLSGPEALQVLASNAAYAHIPKLVWSSSVRTKDIDECMRLGAARYFKKPSSFQELAESIRQINEIFAAQLQNL